MSKYTKELWLEHCAAAWEGQLEFSPRSNHWVKDLHGPCPSDNPDAYRIKPTPKLRPWKADEVPVGALIRGSVGPDIEITTILAINKDKVFFYDGNKVTYNYLSYGMMDCKHSTDGGKTWQPCGVME